MGTFFIIWIIGIIISICILAFSGISFNDIFTDDLFVLFFMWPIVIIVAIVFGMQGLLKWFKRKIKRNKEKQNV